MDKKYNYEHEQDIWLEFYTTFNDVNMFHAQDAFISNRYNEMSAKDLHDENVRWFHEIFTHHGISCEEIVNMMPSAKEYGIEFLERICQLLEQIKQL